jgi:hypothetical protein
MYEITRHIFHEIPHLEFELKIVAGLLLWLSLFNYVTFYARLKLLIDDLKRTLSPPPKNSALRNTLRNWDSSNTFKNISEYAYGNYLTKYTTQRSVLPAVRSVCLTNSKRERTVVFFVASHIGIAIHTVPVTIQNPQQIAASLQLNSTRNDWMFWDFTSPPVIYMSLYFIPTQTS